MCMCNLKHLIQILPSETLEYVTVPNFKNWAPPPPLHLHLGSSPIFTEFGLYIIFIAFLQTYFSMSIILFKCMA